MKTQHFLPATPIRPMADLSARASSLAMMVCLSVTTCGGADGGSGANNALTSRPSPETCPSETAAEARLRFARERRSLPSHGLYEDIRGLIQVRSQESGPTKEAQWKLPSAARQWGIRVVLTADAESPKPDAWRGLHEGVIFLAGAKTSDGALWFPDYAADGQPIPDGGLRFKNSDALHQSVFRRSMNAGPEPGNSSNLVLHLLAREFTEPLIREALMEGHCYAADDGLCDPTGFMFGAINNQGVFTMGDDTRMFGKTRLVAVTPLPARLKLLHGSELVQEAFGTNLTFEAKETGAYRLEASLTAGGEDRPWIYSSPVSLTAPGLSELQRLASLANVSPEVKTVRDISYREGPEDEAAKHKLDIYLPKDKTIAPVFFFIHGGAWRSGDRAQYVALGNRYAREGCVTVVPSYRLAPKYPHPAQIEDVAAAFAWTLGHIAEHGGDTNRVYVGGHSAGGHLAALLTLDPRYLAAHELSPKLIRGVLALSGVYNLGGEGQDSVFGKDPEARRAAAPLSYVHGPAPPFLVTYCQWDYFSLPAQAREFHRALRLAGVSAELVYIPRQSHISEMVNVTSDDDPTVAAAVKFMR
jgi:acetyl esterase/lipase